MKFGFITVAAAIPSVKVADTEYNIKQIEDFVAQAEGRGVEIIVFPELSVTGYSCQDLFLQQLLVEQAEVAVMQLLDFSRKLDIICIVGAPVNISGSLYNCAVVIQHGVILGIIPKTYLPNYGEFYEKRWFTSSKDLKPTDIRYAGNSVSITPGPTLFRTSDNALFGVEICEDVWAAEPCSNKLALAGADIIFNLSASDELIGKHIYLMNLLSQQSARTISGYVYSGCGFGESTQDVVYGGNALIYENGTLLSESERFSFKPQMIVNQIDIEKLRVERQKNTTFVNCRDDSNAVIKQTAVVQPKNFSLLREIDALPFVPDDNDMEHSCNEIFSIQVAGLAKRIMHTTCKHLIVGISGGLDSTLALLVCVKTFDKLGMNRKGIVGVTMPGFGTTDRTYNNALSLMNSLGVTIREISIADSVKVHFNDIGHDISVHDVTYENSQARERTQILMDLSNQLKGMVVGTGDLSELALGWATYNGDHMSMYGVNASVPKTLVRHLVHYYADTCKDQELKDVLYDVLDTPVSPELLPPKDGEIAQKTEDLVGPYELHDFFLYYLLRFSYEPGKIYRIARYAFDGEYDDATIYKWLYTFCRRFFIQQFKRSCLPDGPKVGTVALSPRGDWRMPSDACAEVWLRDLEKAKPVGM